MSNLTGECGRPGDTKPPMFDTRSAKTQHGARSARGVNLRSSPGANADPAQSLSIVASACARVFAGRIKGPARRWLCREVRRLSPVPSSRCPEKPFDFVLCKPRRLCYTLRVANAQFGTFLGSSAVEHSTVNRMVAGSNPARGATGLKTSDVDPHAARSRGASSRLPFRHDLFGRPLIFRQPSRRDR